MSAVPLPEGSPKTAGAPSAQLLSDKRVFEFFFAVVGPAGAGSSRAAKALARSLEAKTLGGHPIKAQILKASDCIREWAEASKLAVPHNGTRTLAATRMMQDRGDDMRRAGDKAAVARAMLGKVAEARAKMMNITYRMGEPVEPDDNPRAFIIDSIRHPDEARLLRRVYDRAFALVGVVCEETVRLDRLLGKFFTEPEAKKPENLVSVKEFVKRDSGDGQEKYGQQVSDAFHEADYFLDNTEHDDDEQHPAIGESLGRLADIIIHDRIVRPTIAETAMHHAYSAKLRSACLSRQVGAALTDVNGNIIATGTNEVPKAGGGVYGENAQESARYDDRCAFKDTKCCSNNIEQNEIIEELIAAIPQLLPVNDDTNSQKKGIVEAIRRTRIGQLLEFSRAVHAEMDAVLSAARTGVSPLGGRLYVTTYPCHYCARHLVSAGVYEVQYIEPYPKSLALKLHKDAIEADPANWLPPHTPTTREYVKQAQDAATRARKEIERQKKLARGGEAKALDHVDEPPGPGKVLFRPFVGVAPRMYARAFLKDREYKDRLSGKFQIGDAEWGGEWGEFRVAYFQLEAGLTKPDRA